MVLDFAYLTTLTLSLGLAVIASGKKGVIVLLRTFPLNTRARISYTYTCILVLHFRTLSKAVYEEEQRGYYILSSFWAELDKDQVLGEPAVVQTFDMHTCTLEDVQVNKIPVSKETRTVCLLCWFFFFKSPPVSLVVGE